MSGLTKTFLELQTNYPSQVENYEQSTSEATTFGLHSDVDPVGNFDDSRMCADVDRADSLRWQPLGRPQDS